MTDAPILEEDLLGTLPESLRGELLHAYAEITRNYLEHRWESAELNGGKLCEVVYSILSGYVNGSYPQASTKPAKNMVDACRSLEQAPATFPRSVRIQIPRMLIALYEIRNNRGVGHVGGDVDPNQMDASCVLEMSRWVVGELVRLFHNVTPDQAQLAVDGLVERIVPLVWQVGDTFRVLDPAMTMRNKVLVLLYHSRGPVEESRLCKWVEHSNPTTFRRDVLRKAHREKLVEYDPGKKTVQISPLGIRLVETSLLKPV